MIISSNKYRYSPATGGPTIVGTDIIIKRLPSAGDSLPIPTISFVTKGIRTTKHASASPNISAYATRAWYPVPSGSNVVDMLIVRSPAWYMYKMLTRLLSAIFPANTFPIVEVIERIPIRNDAFSSGTPSNTACRFWKSKIMLLLSVSIWSGQVWWIPWDKVIAWISLKSVSSTNGLNYDKSLQTEIFCNSRHNNRKLKYQISWFFHIMSIFGPPCKGKSSSSEKWTEFSFY